MEGFESYNKFKKDIKDSKQIYDITYHLYQLEKKRLKQELKQDKLKPTWKTTVGTIEHSPTALYERLEHLYPFKLRQLILISSITSLEVYLTDVILEIFKRDISPFKVSDTITFQRNYLLSMSSVNKIQNDIISKDFRNLTSGGLKEIEKYYKKLFEIDIRNIGINFQDIEEIHTRRHLFVHRNGITDLEYVKRFPAFGYKVSQQIKIEHNYLILSLNKLLEFGRLINKELSNKYPDANRNKRYYSGSNKFRKDLKNLMIDISILEDKFDIIDYLDNLEVDGIKFADYIVQITVLDNSCNLFISGRNDAISKFFNPIIEHGKMLINKTIEIKDSI